jgi:hypothetical protein
MIWLAVLAAVEGVVDDRPDSIPPLARRPADAVGALVVDDGIILRDSVISLVRH